jgi:hypothetical protein
MKPKYDTEVGTTQNIHTLLPTIKIQGENPLLISPYNNKRMGFFKRRLPLINEKPKGFVQSLRDIFFQIL